MRSSLFLCLLFGAPFGAPAGPLPGSATDSLLSIYILAGQSNALNWHCDAALLPADISDASILFFYHSGAPPDRSYPLPFNATSGGKWVNLRAQRQDPFIAHKQDFFGPEMGLGRTLAQNAVHTAILKCAYFGTDLAHDWRKGDTSGAGLYSILLEQVAIATRGLDSAGIPFLVKGFFWMQGETDAASASAAAAYGENLSRFIRDVRTDLQASNLPFIVGRIGNASAYPYRTSVRTAQMEVAATTENVGWVDTDDLPLDADNVHLIAPGALLLGERMARTYLSIPTGVTEGPPSHPASLRLEQNYPNPFNPATRIRFTLAEPGHALLMVFDPLGREVERVVDEERSAGTHTVTFNASSLSSGIYFYRLSAGRGQITRKMALAR
jgi:hypothetical protein